MIKKNELWKLKKMMAQIKKKTKFGRTVKQKDKKMKKGKEHLGKLDYQSIQDVQDVNKKDYGKEK